jgi:ATP-dependent Clp protease ATP-binding subunit ClpB
MSRRWRGISATPFPSAQGSGAACVPSLNRILEDSKEADNFKDDYVSTEHLLIALTNAKGEEVSRPCRLRGVTKDSILKVWFPFAAARNYGPESEEKYQAATLLTRLPSLRAGQTGSSHWPRREVRRVQVLSKEPRAIPVLIGERV